MRPTPGRRGDRTAEVAASFARERRFSASLRHHLHLTGPWSPVPGYTDVIGNNATVAYPTQEPNAAYYYRGKVWLTRP